MQLLVQLPEKILCLWYKILQWKHMKFVKLPSLSKMFNNVKSIEKTHIESEKLKNSFAIKKDRSLIIYGSVICFGYFLITFRLYYYAKYMFLT